MPVNCDEASNDIIEAKHVDNKNTKESDKSGFGQRLTANEY